MILWKVSRCKYALFLIVTLFNLSSYAYDSCSMQFMPYLNRLSQAQAKTDSFLNVWRDDFDFIRFEMIALNGRLPNKQLEIFDELISLLHSDRIFAENLAELFTHWLSKNPKLSNDLFNIVREQSVLKDRYKIIFLKGEQKFYSVIDISPEKKNLISEILNSKGLKSKYRKKYEDQLFVSSLTPEELVVLKKHWKPTQIEKDYEQFVDYLNFLTKLEPHVKLKALSDINKIYNYSYRPLPGSLNFVKTPVKEFLSQQYRINAKTVKRYKELSKIHTEQQGKLTFNDKVRYLNQSKHEMNIYKKFLNGCGGGKTQRIDGAAKKFSRFKLGLLLTINPSMYLAKNYDKKDTDPYFWEKLGHEVALGLMFTFVGNKLITNTGTTFWGKYFEGLWKFGMLGFAETGSYDYLFGNKNMMGYLKNLYAKGDFSESPIEKEFNRIKNSPKLDEEIKKLISFLQDKKKDKNLKNFLNKHFNLYASSSLEDSYKITREDLESEEAREFLMQLVAERIYLMNMGNWPIFQSGNKGVDRWLFYNSRNILFDVKSLALNLAIFEMMCREPFGKVGSWGAVIAMVMADYYISGDITYGYRRDAINQ